MKRVIALIAATMVLLSVPQPSVAASDRDAADRQTRQESDELRADIRQRRLKRMQELEAASKQQKSNQATGTKKDTSKPGE